MNYGEFKENLKNLLSGDTELRSDSAAVSAIYRRALESVISDTEPLSLITSDIERFKPFRWLDKVWFIRYPSLPTVDSDPLDIDDTLQEAILYLAAADLTRRDGEQARRIQYQHQAAVIKDRYIYEIFGYLQNIACESTDGERKDIPVSLDRWGLLKFYRVYRAVKGYNYRWSSDITDTVDRFMMDEDGSRLSPSSVALWEQLIGYQDGKVDVESAALGVLDGIFLERAI